MATNKGFIMIADGQLGVHVLREATDPELYQRLIDTAFAPPSPAPPKPKPKPQPAPPSQLTLLWPTVTKRVTQRFGVNRQTYEQFGLPGHEGLDMAADDGTKLFAVTDMRCTVVDKDKQHKFYGWSVRFEFKHLDRTYQVTYAHMKHPAKVKVGDVVQRGAVVGFADNTGNSFGSHLHLMLKRRGATANGETNFPNDIIDPTPFFEELR
jgi:murein DD-endopeptidase MepM/ murein hydrolase activator NlpD